MSLDRRHFLAASAAALAAPTFAAAPMLGPRVGLRAPRRRTIRKSLKYGMIGEGSSLRDKFLLAADVGFDGVEMDSPNGFDAEEVLRAKEESGLEIPGVVDSIHWGKTLGDPDPAVRAAGVAGLETALRDCKTYGGTTVLLVPGVVNEQMPYHLVYERSQAEIRKVLPLATELDVKIAFENVWNNFLLSPVEARRYIDEFESDRVGWYLDVGNLVRYGWPEHWVQALGRRVLKLDVKEYSRKKQNDEGIWKGFQVEIGEGDCGWPRVMAALDEVGYGGSEDPDGPGASGGWASAEVGGGDRARLVDILARMRAVLDA